jgi:hypothetical protein
MCRSILTTQDGALAGTTNAVRPMHISDFQFNPTTPSTIGWCLDTSILFKEGEPSDESSLARTPFYFHVTNVRALSATTLCTCSKRLPSVGPAVGASPDPSPESPEQKSSASIRFIATRQRMRGIESCFLYGRQHRSLRIQEYLSLEIGSSECDDPGLSSGQVVCSFMISDLNSAPLAGPQFAPQHQPITIKDLATRSTFDFPGPARNQNRFGSFLLSMLFVLSGQV